MPLKRALEIAYHVTDALAAAHEKGIVHRDVKPENVFLTRDGHVKLLDFGLARHENAFRDPDDSHTPTVSARTEAGAVVGTVAYMSPEQARGLPVDHRTDQFSLGVTLYEMLAGKRPFRGETAADVLAAILTREPEALPSGDPPLPTPVLPTPVRLVVERYLAREPHERYASTRDLARDLASWREHSSGAPAPGVPASGIQVSVTAGTLSTAGRSPAARRRLVTAVAAGVLVLAAPAVAWLWGGRRGGEKAPGTTASGAAAPGTPALDPQRVVVAVFENRTGDPSLDDLGKIAADWITEALVPLGADVLPSTYGIGASTPQGSKAEGDPALALARRTGSGLLVAGSYNLLGNRIQVRACLLDAATGRVLAAPEPASGPRGDPMQALDAARLAARDAVAIHLGKDVQREVSAWAGRHVPRYEAYREFVLGLSADPDFPKAIVHFERAVELDGDFDGAMIKLFDVLGYSRRFEEAERFAERLEGRIDQLSPFQRLNFRALRAFRWGRYEAALASSRELLRLTPSSSWNRLLYVTFALAANHPRKALEELERLDSFASPVPSVSQALFSRLALSLHVLGRYEDELDAVRRGLASEAVERHRAAPPAGKPRDLRGLAFALYHAERWAEALPALREAAEAYPEAWPTFVGLRALVAQRLGDEETARRIEEELRTTTRRWLHGEHTYFRACLAAWRGEKDAAVRLLETAIGEGWP